MLQVANSKCIRRLSRRAMGAARVRNLVAILAIALTTILFTSLFTIALSINDGVQQANFRMVGGYSHGGFKYLTAEQAEELKDHPLIQEYGLRRYVGVPQDIPFNKDHVEVGWSDANDAKWMYCQPVQGSLPAEGTQEAATDTRVLSLLGIEPELGAEFTLTFDVDGEPTTQTFILSGWWEYDEAIMASHVLIPASRAEAIFAELGTEGKDGITGRWNLNVMLESSLHIEEDLRQILADNGYTNSGSTMEENHIPMGVNWAYTGAQLAMKLDFSILAAIVAFLLLIAFTGYLIIYNVFHISVVGDIRFYGLLKTIGATGRQLRRIIRQQALLLSAVGVPLGLLGGWLVGAKLTPTILAQLDGVADTVSVSPLIFLLAALFSLLTTLISCSRPGRLAGRVSPLEALGYTGVAVGKKARKRGGGKVSPLAMAWANMGRNKSKTIITVASLSLAVVLVTMTATFTKGFDMEKYLAYFTSTDFILADAGYFQTSGIFSHEQAVAEEAIAEIEAQGQVEGGRVYGGTSMTQETVTEEHFRAKYSRWNSGEVLDQWVAAQERTTEGLLRDDVQLYGMEPFILDRLTLLAGDLSSLYEPGSRNIAAVYHQDDYGAAEEDSNWAQLGDIVTVRYVDEYYYADPDTGAPVDPETGAEYEVRPVSYREIDYTVTALAAVPNPLSYRYFGSDSFVLNEQTFIADSKTEAIMLYAFDTPEPETAAMEDFLAGYTATVAPEYDYESRATAAAEFYNIRSMFVLLGSALSLIVGLVGALNFFNAVLTGVITRRRELAMLQSIGMTNSQLKAMLMGEGLIYSLASLLLSLVLALTLGPLLASAVSSMFWFFTYRLTITPILLLTPVFLLLGSVTPRLVCRRAVRSTLVERLREAE